MVDKVFRKNSEPETLDPARILNPVSGRRGLQPVPDTAPGTDYGSRVAESKLKSQPQLADPLRAQSYVAHFAAK